MKSRLKLRPIGSAALCAALCLGASAFAQDASNQSTTSTTTKTAKAAASGLDEYPDLIEIDPFGGVST